jgi:hypothetical protein
MYMRTVISCQGLVCHVPRSLVKANAVFAFLPAIRTRSLLDITHAARLQKLKTTQRSQAWQLYVFRTVLSMGVVPLILAIVFQTYNDRVESCTLDLVISETKRWTNRNSFRRTEEPFTLMDISSRKTGRRSSSKCELVVVCECV